MDIVDIERLVSIFRDANISELLVETGSSDGAKVRLRKPLKRTAQSQPSTTPRLVQTAHTSPASATPHESRERYITASMVGIFHTIDSVGAVGCAVRSGGVVGAIESLKLANDVVSEYDGVITEMLVEDGMPVEYGQNLFKVENQ